MSVWLASQTSRTITIRGKKALRKKRFTKSPWSGYPTPYFAGTEFLSRRASAYTPSGMRSSSRRRLGRRSEDVTAPPARPSEVAVLEDPDDPGGVGRGAVARDRHEVDLAGHRDRAHQVGHEEDRSLEHAHEQELAPRVVGGNLAAELVDACLEHVLLDQDLADSALDLRAVHVRTASIPGASTMPGTATTSSPRTTSGQPSRSERGTFASTKTSCTFFDRPASRSPGLQPRTRSPGNDERIRQSPQRTSPSRATGTCSSQRRSCSRTACSPPPRSTRFDPVGESSSVAMAGGIVRRLSRARRMFARAAGWSCSSSGRIWPRIKPRTVSGFDASVRYSNSRSRQNASVSSRQTDSSGRTTPSSRLALMPFVFPLVTSR